LHDVGVVRGLCCVELGREEGGECVVGGVGGGGGVDGERRVLEAEEGGGVEAVECSVWVVLV